MNSQEDYDGEDMADTLIGYSWHPENPQSTTIGQQTGSPIMALSNLPDLAMREGDWKLLFVIMMDQTHSSII